MSPSQRYGNRVKDSTSNPTFRKTSFVRLFTCSSQVLPWIFMYSLGRSHLPPGEERQKEAALSGQKMVTEHNIQAAFIFNWPISSQGWKGITAATMSLPVPGTSDCRMSFRRCRGSSQRSRRFKQLITSYLKPVSCHASIPSSLISTGI